MIVTLVGLDYAGKSSIRIYLESFDVEKAMDTETSNSIEELRGSKVVYYVIPGQELLRYEEKFYERLFPITDVIVFVVDAADKEKFGEVREFFKFIQEMIKKYAKEECRLIVLAHKQDLPNAAKAKEVAELLGISEKHVLETSIKYPGSMYELLMRIHGIPTTEFDAIAYQIMQDTNAESVTIADKDLFPYTSIGNKDDAMTKLVGFLRLTRDIGDFDFIICEKESKRTCCIKDYIDGEEIFIVIINARANFDVMMSSVKAALSKIREEYKRRWEL